MNRALLLALLAALIWSASSCNFYRRVTGRKKPIVSDSSLVAVTDSLIRAHDSAAAVLRDTGSVVPTVAIDSTQIVLLQSLLPFWEAQTVWQTFNGKAKVHFEGKGDNQDFTLTIRMERDKSVWMSVTALGFYEAARVFITPDTIQIIDRMHKEARVMPFSASDTLLPMHTDFASLQALLIGDVLHTVQQPVTATIASTTLDLATSRMAEPYQIVQFEKSDTSLRAQSLAAGGSTLSCEYSGRKGGAARGFPDRRSILMSDRGEAYKIDLEFSTATFNEAIDQPFSIPDKYERK